MVRKKPLCKEKRNLAKRRLKRKASSKAISGRSEKVAQYTNRTEKASELTCYCVLAIGPRDYDEQDHVWGRLDRFADNYDKIILIESVEPNKEYQRSPENWAAFPVAVHWAMHKKRLQSVMKFHAPYKGNKQWSKGIERQLELQLKHSDVVLAFRDFEDEIVENVIKMAKRFKVPVIEERI